MICKYVILVTAEKQLDFQQADAHGNSLSSTNHFFTFFSRDHSTAQNIFSRIARNEFSVSLIKIFTEFGLNFKDSIMTKIFAFTSFTSAYLLVVCKFFKRSRKGLRTIVLTRNSSLKYFSF